MIKRLFSKQLESSAKQIARKASEINRRKAAQAVARKGISLHTSQAQRPTGTVRKQIINTIRSAMAKHGNSKPSRS